MPCERFAKMTGGDVAESALPQVRARRSRDGRNCRRDYTRAPGLDQVEGGERQPKKPAEQDPVTRQAVPWIGRGNSTATERDQCGCAQN